MPIISVLHGNSCIVFNICSVIFIHVIDTGVLFPCEYTENGVFTLITAQHEHINIEELKLTNRFRHVLEYSL